MRKQVKTGFLFYRVKRVFLIKELKFKYYIQQYTRQYYIDEDYDTYFADLWLNCKEINKATYYDLKSHRRDPDYQSILYLVCNTSHKILNE